MEIIERYSCAETYHGKPGQAALIYTMISIADPIACLEWPFKRHKRTAQYGIVRHDGKDWRVHRLAWKIVHGELDSDICVLHKCDNPPCFNPNHLFLGTRTDNAMDRDLKGRCTGPINPHRPFGPRPNLWGEKSPVSKLTTEKVTKIKQLLALGHTQQSIAGQFGVNQTLISAIKLGKTWNHVSL